MGGNQVVLLTSIGRRSGKPRDTPLLGTPDGADWLVVASNGGTAHDPDWLRNIRADPNVTLTAGSSSSPATASELHADEREQWWPQLVGHYQASQGYQDRTNRQIAVVRVSPRPATGNASQGEPRP
jgi:deazaflavin-dependent oxidoreductase (nitroreductase family)